MLVAAVGPRAAAAVLVCFADMVCPCAYLDEDAGKAGRGTAARLCLLTGSTPVPSRLRGFVMGRPAGA
eukprot:2135931-Pleurochrysis_carterae.AAC.1